MAHRLSVNPPRLFTYVKPKLQIGICIPAKTTDRQGFDFSSDYVSQR